MLTPTAIQANNLFLFASLGAVTPYLSTYFVHYTNASSVELGKVMLCSSTLGMVCNLTLSSLADRYRAHRVIYLMLLIITYATFTTLLVPVLSDSIYDSQASHLAPIDPKLSIADLSASLTEAGSPAPSGEIDTNLTLSPALEILEETRFSVDSLTPEQHVPDNRWFYLISILIATGEMTSTICMNLSDSYAANIAKRCNVPFGSVRFWGAMGWVSVAILLSYANTIRTVPFLAPSLSVYTILAAINILIVYFWPDKRPFDLSDDFTHEGPGSSVSFSDQDEYNEGKTTSSNRARGLKFSFKPNRISVLSNYFGSTIHGLQDELRLSHIISRDKFSPPQMTSENLHGVVVVRCERASSFDTREEDFYRNIRRCSLAPLGEQHVIKQFELNKTSGKHFKFVTHIEPKKIENERLSNGLIELPAHLRQLAEKNLALAGQSDDYLSFNGDSQHSENGNPPSDNIGLQVHLKTIQLIIMRNKFLLRFFFLCMVHGFVINMNWLYLFPYLRSLDEMKFRSLSAHILIGCNLSETLFYYTSPNFTRKLGPAINLSLILLVYALRYSLYLIFALENMPVPLELIIVVELLQALNLSWFTCVLNESVLEFALEAKYCVPKLIELGLIDNSRDTADKVSNSVKVTMLSIATCCSDGLGVAFGSICGGWLIDTFGYKTLWSTSALIAVSVGLLNLMVEFWTYRSRQHDGCANNKINGIKVH